MALRVHISIELVFRLEKRSKKVLLVFRVNADPVVLDQNAQTSFFVALGVTHPDSDVDGAAVFRELDRVGEQI